MAQTVLPPRQPVVDRGGPSLVPGGGRQRRWSLALLAVLLTVGSALAFVILWLNAGDKKPVLAVARPVQAGQTFSAEDLTVVRISIDPGIAPVASSARSQVIGRTASVDLLPGTLLVADAVGDPSADADTRILSVSLDAARVPDLERGDHVTVLRTDTSSSTEAVATELGDARVLAVDDADGGRVAVQLSVDKADANTIVAAAAKPDQVSIIKS
ncbi:MAG TPA: SAF domain-containing protein [Acidimicrobiales bacterium]|jgi:hypothetical protein